MNDRYHRMLIEAYHDQHYRELLEEAARERMLKEARARNQPGRFRIRKDVKLVAKRRLAYLLAVALLVALLVAQVVQAAGGGAGGGGGGYLVM